MEHPTTLSSVSLHSMIIAFSSLHGTYLRTAYRVVAVMAVATVVYRDVVVLAVVIIN